MDGLIQRVYLWTGVILILIAIICSLTNATLLYIMYKNPLHCFRNTASTFIVCLSVADFLTGAVTAIEVGISSLLATQGIPFFKVRGIPHGKLVAQFTVNSGILMVVGFSIERFIAVACPYFYRHHVTPKKAFVVCIFCFLTCFLGSLTEFVLDKYTLELTSFYGFITPLTLILLAYLFVYIAIKHKQRNVLLTGSVCDHRERLRNKRERKLVITAFYIVLGFLFSYCFWFTVVLIGNSCPDCKTQSWYYACYWISIPFLYVNSALNLLLYAWRIQLYRRSFVLVFRNTRAVKIWPRVSATRVQSNVGNQEL